MERIRNSILPADVCYEPSVSAEFNILNAFKMLLSEEKVEINTDSFTLSEITPKQSRDETNG